jgi:predicted Na+-dependent transporter
MKVLLPLPVFVLMVSVGMSLRLPKLVAQWRRWTWTAWLRLLLATFIVPPLFVLLLYHLIPLGRAQAIGLFMVAVVPGAPLMTRNIARRGFDMHLAASYQVWGACLTPVMIPLVVFLTGRLYDRDIWISPPLLIAQIAEKQFVPVLLGMLLMRIAPERSKRLGPALSMVGNVMLLFVILLVLIKVAPSLRDVTVWLPVSALLLAIACIAAIRLLSRTDVLTQRTLAICNANRFAGLALLLTDRSLHRSDALPAVACYALVVALATILYPRFFPAKQLKAAAS